MSKHVQLRVESDPGSILRVKTRILDLAVSDHLTCQHGYSVVNKVSVQIFLQMFGNQASIRAERRAV